MATQTFSPFEVPVIAKHPRDQLVDAPTQYYRFSLGPATAWIQNTPTLPVTTDAPVIAGLASAATIASADAAEVINAPRDVTLPVTRMCAPRRLTYGNRSDHP